MVNDIPANFPSVANGISIHWHGFSMRGKEWYDGTGRITQCPIAPGTNFTYNFKVFFARPVDSCRTLACCFCLFRFLLQVKRASSKRARTPLLQSPRTSPWPLLIAVLHCHVCRPAGKAACQDKTLSALTNSHLIGCLSAQMQVDEQPGTYCIVELIYGVHT